MRMGEYETKKADVLDDCLKDDKMTYEEKHILLLKSIAESLAIIAGKIGRKLL
jgi:hypothetical protein